MTRAQSAVLRQLISEKAVIYRGRFSGAWPAYPYGDKRRRPTCWLDEIMFKALRADEYLTRDGHGFRVNPSIIRRMDHPVPERAHSAQHIQTEERDIYTPAGVVRSVKVNTSQSQVERLKTLKGSDGDQFFTSAEIEAAIRFTTDYARAGYSQLSTQNYMAAGKGTSSKAHTQATDRMVDHIGSSDRYKAALSAIGSGLDTVVLAICGRDVSLNAFEQSENWPRHSARTVLKLALQKLVHHYGTEPGYRPLRK